MVGQLCLSNVEPMSSTFYSGSNSLYMIEIKCGNFFFFLEHWQRWCRKLKMISNLVWVFERIASFVVNDKNTENEYGKLLSGDGYYDFIVVILFVLQFLILMFINFNSEQIWTFREK